MSRFRYVKGNITKITGGKHRMFSKENIEFISAKRVIQVGDEGGVSYGRPDPFPPKSITCLYLEKGWWTSDKEGNRPLKEAELGDVVYFHIQTKPAFPEGTLLVQLKDSDTWQEHLTDVWDDELDTESTSSLGINRLYDQTKAGGGATKVQVKNHRAVLELHITEDGSVYKALADEHFDAVELYFHVCYHATLGNDRRYPAYKEAMDFPEEKAQYLKVTPKTEPNLILLQPAQGYGFPDLRTESGDVLFIGEYDVEEEPKDPIEQGKESLQKTRKYYKAQQETTQPNALQRHNREYAVRQLEKGKLVASNGKVYTRKKVYTQTIAGLDGKPLQIKRAINFGWKANGVPYTTKIDQIASFERLARAQRSSVVPTLKTFGEQFLKKLSFITEVAENLQAIEQGKPPTILGPINWYVEDYINQIDQMVEQDWYNKLDAAIAGGLSSIKRHIGYNPNQPSATGRYHFGLWSVSTDTLNQLIIGEIRFYDKIKQEVNKNDGSITILYQQVSNPENKLKEEYYIHAIFINEEILE